MPRIGSNIYKRKDGRWEGRYIKARIEGKAVYGAVYAHSYQDVKKKLDKARNTANNTTVRRESVTIIDAGTAWLSDAAPMLKESSLLKYEDILRCYISPYFGDALLSEITNVHIMDFGNKLLQAGGKNGQGLSKTTVQGIISTMNSIRIYALRHGHAVSFTTEGLCVKKDMPEFRVFSFEEEQRLVAWLTDHMSLTSLTILLCLFTGIRVGEACALTWDDFDFSTGTLSVNKTMQRMRVKGNPDKKTEIRITKPKSGCSARLIPMPENIRNMLYEHYRVGAYLLTGMKDEYIEPRTLQNRFKSILKQAGIEDANFHTTRHTFATRCVEQGFDIKCLSEILGHASVSITLNRYVHPTMSLKSKNMEKLSELFPLG